MSAAAPDPPAPGPAAPRWVRLVAATWTATRRFIDGVWDQLTGPVVEPLETCPPPAPPPPGEITLHQELATPIPAGAWGEVFEFQVYVTFDWTSTGLVREELSARSREFVAEARRRVAREAADLAHWHSPHRARDLELALNSRLAGTTWEFPRDGVVVTCRAETRVRLDDRVRRQLEPIWAKMIKMEAEHEVNQRRAELVDDLNRRWLATVEKLRGSPVASSAARITVQEFADVVRQLAADQQEVVNQLAALLETIKQHDHHAADHATDADPGTTQRVDLLNDLLGQELAAESAHRPPGPDGDTSS